MLRFFICAVCIIYPVAFAVLYSNVVVYVRIDPDHALKIWTSRTLCRISTLLWFLNIPIAITAFRVLFRIRVEYCQSLGRFLPAFRPLALLPAWALLIPLGNVIPRRIFANLLFYVPVLVGSTVVSSLLNIHWKTGNGSMPVRGSRILGVILISSAVYFSTGLYFTRFAGPHATDEGHYMVQAESLYYDHDIDLRNDLADEVASSERITRDYLNISPRSRGKHWYSYHACGLPLLLAPLVPLGEVGRHLALGLIAGIGCGAIFWLSRLAGASSRSTLTVVIFFGASYYWMVYSSRCLPEILGATLALWVLWSMVFAGRYPWRTVIIASFCCAYLLWTNIRHIPLSVFTAALYICHLVIASLPVRRKLMYVAFFLVLYSAAVGMFVYVQSRMFEGGFSHPVRHVLLSLPLGAWYIIAGFWGVLNTFPLFAWLLVANLFCVLLEARWRWYAGSSLAILIAVMFATCTGANYFGGSVPGRFLVVAVPLLLPGAAVALDKASRTARWWFIFLGTISVAYALLTLLYLPDLKRSFTPPVSVLPVVCPPLRGLLSPYCHFSSYYPFIGKQADWFMRIIGSGFVILMLVVTCVLIFMKNLRKVTARLMIAMLGCAAVYSSIVVDTPAYAEIEKSNIRTPGEVGKILSSMDLDRVYVARQLSDKLVGVFEVSDSLSYMKEADLHVSVTTEDLGMRMLEKTVSQPNLEKNDWDGRDLAWTTLAAPFDPGKGRRILCIEGILSGDARPVLALREGSHLIYEGSLACDSRGRIKQCFDILCRGGSGHFYVLLRLEKGAGTFELTNIKWTPWSERLIKQAGLRLPENIIHLPPLH